MAENLTNLVLQLAQNPQLVAEFQKDPDGTSKRAGLSNADVAVLESGDAKLLRQALVTDLGSKLSGGGAAMGITVVVLTYTRMPASVQLSQSETSIDFQTRVQQLIK